MKKIISIILGVLLMFSMSVTSFAGLVAEPTTSASTEVVEPENVIIGVDFTSHDFVSMNTASAFLTSAKLHVTIDNNLNKAISLSDIVIDVAVKTPAKNDKNELIKTEDGKPVYDTPAVSIDGISLDSDYIINKKTDKAIDVYYDLIINYDSARLTEEAIFTISINGIEKENITVKSPWIYWTFVEEIEVEDTTPSIPSEPESTEKEETPTDVPTQAPTEAPEVTNPVEDTENDYVAPPVDDYIPDTGAATPIGAIGTLIGSAIAAVIAKKRKKIDE